MSAFQPLFETFINRHLMFKKSLLIAKNIEYIDLREVNYSKDSPSKAIFTKNGICVPSSVSEDLKDVLQDSLTVPFKNRLCVRNHGNQYFIFLQTVDPNTSILTIKRETGQLAQSLFLTRLDVISIIKQL